MSDRLQQIRELVADGVFAANGEVAYLLGEIDRLTRERDEWQELAKQRLDRAVENGERADAQHAELYRYQAREAELMVLLRAREWRLDDRGAVEVCDWCGIEFRPSVPHDLREHQYDCALNDALARYEEAK